MGKLRWKPCGLQFQIPLKALIPAVLAVAVMLCPLTAGAESVDLAIDPGGAVQKEEEPVCAKVAEAMNAGPAVVLPAAEVGAQDELEAIASWNREVGRPIKNGFSRPLAVPQKVAIETAAASGATASPQSRGDEDFLLQGDHYVWSTRVDVEGAYRLRLHLDQVNLPPKTVMWVYGRQDDTPVRFGPELAYEGSLWTPSVEGETLFFELSIPTDAAGADSGFMVDAVLEMFELNDAGEPIAVPLPEGEECFRDAACYGNSTWSNLDAAKLAIGRMLFVKSGSSYVCSGGMMNDKDVPGFIPYFLTANHCISSQVVASTLETRFNYINTSCGGSLNTSGPVVIGATLLATDAGSDGTFLLLSSTPPGRAYLGWTGYPFGDGIHIHRLSHPHGGAMVYSVTRSDATPPATCSGFALSDFIYSEIAFGGTTGGSSGAPGMNVDGQVIGQIYGKCGPTSTINDPCSSSNYSLDGRFSKFYPFVEQWLNPTTPPPNPGEPCIPGPTTMCLNNGEFKVEVNWRDQYNNTGMGRVVPFGSSDAGLFWFFNSSNWEMLIKVLNGCSFNNRYWVFFAATTDQQFTVTVTDTVYGVVKQYFNPLKNPADAVTDTNAFATCRP